MRPPGWAASRLMKLTPSFLVVTAVTGIVFGCATRRVPDSGNLLCGGTISAEMNARQNCVATATEYSWTRSWVEQHCPASAVPVSNRVFVIQETRPRMASIVAHRSDLTLGDVLRQTGIIARRVRVLRQSGLTDDQQFDTDDPTCEIRELDVVSVGGRAE